MPYRTVAYRAAANHGPPHPTSAIDGTTMTVIEVLDQHIPSLSDEDEDELIVLADKFSFSEADAADLALRTCSCGVRIDGFYEYVDHLKARLKEAGLITDMGVLPAGGET